MQAAFTLVSCVPKDAKRLSFSEVFRISLEGILLGLNFSNIFFQRLQSYWDVDSLIDDFWDGLTSIRNMWSQATHYWGRPRENAAEVRAFLRFLSREKHTARWV